MKNSFDEHDDAQVAEVLRSLDQQNSFDANSLAGRIASKRKARSHCRIVVTGVGLSIAIAGILVAVAAGPFWNLRPDLSRVAQVDSVSTGPQKVAGGDVEKPGAHQSAADSQEFRRGSIEPNESFDMGSDEEIQRRRETAIQSLKEEIGEFRAASDRLKMAAFRELASREL